MMDIVDSPNIWKARSLSTAKVLLITALATFSWISLFTGEIAEEVIFKRQLSYLGWVIFIAAVGIWFISGRFFKKILFDLALASIGGFFVQVLNIFLGRGENYGCTSYCLGVLNHVLGLGCAYAEEGCTIEVFLISFFIFIAFIFLWRGWRKYNNN